MLFRPAPHSGEIHCSMRILTRKLLAVASHKGLGSFPGKVTQAHPLKEKTPPCTLLYMVFSACSKVTPLYPKRSCMAEVQGGIL